MLISWCIGAFMYYGIFYRYRLVPRWISAWGLIGITLTVVASILVMLEIIPGFGTVQMIANLLFGSGGDLEPVARPEQSTITLYNIEDGFVTLRRYPVVL